MRHDLRGQHRRFIDRAVQQLGEIGRIGAAEAARFYFQKPLADLSLGECALLAGIPQAPSRLNPLRHELRYRVFNLLADVDRLDTLSSSLRLFSYNRFNLFSIMDRNHGPGDGTSVRDHAWALVRGAEGGDALGVGEFIVGARDDANRGDRKSVV